MLTAPGPALRVWRSSQPFDLKTHERKTPETGKDNPLKPPGEEPARRSRSELFNPAGRKLWAGGIWLAHRRKWAGVAAGGRLAKKT
jgi:hypothetical protein